MRIFVLLVILGSLAVVMTTTVARVYRDDAADGPVSELVPADGPEAAQWAAYESRSRAAFERSSTKCEIASALVRGEIGLLDAAARFHDLTESDPRSVANLHASFPGRTDVERCARAVISYVRALSWEQNDTAFANWLEEELKRLLASGAFGSDREDAVSTVSFRPRCFGRVHAEIGGSWHVAC